MNRIQFEEILRKAEKVAGPTGVPCQRYIRLLRKAMLQVYDEKYPHQANQHKDPPPPLPEPQLGERGPKKEHEKPI